MYSCEQSFKFSTNYINFLTKLWFIYLCFENCGNFHSVAIAQLFIKIILRFWNIWFEKKNWLQMQDLLRTPTILSQNKNVGKCVARKAIWTVHMIFSSNNFGSSGNEYALFQHRKFDARFMQPRSHQSTALSFSSST